MLLLSLVLSGLGLLIATFMTSQQGFQLLIQLLIFPLIFLAGVFFPVNNVPWWMEIISKLNPVTYGVDAIRQIFLGPNPALGVTVFGHTMTMYEEFALVGVLGIVFVGAAVWAFRPSGMTASPTQPNARSRSSGTWMNPTRRRRAPRNPALLHATLRTVPPPSPATDERREAGCQRPARSRTFDPTPSP